MRRTALFVSTALTALACALPSGALAHGRHHHRGHHHANRARQAWHDGWGTHSGTGSSGIQNVGPTQGNPGENAGTVVSFTEGVLTIKLGEGEKATTISGKVNEETQIHCFSAPSTTPTTPTANTSDNRGWGSWRHEGQQDSSAEGTGRQDDQGSGDDNGGDSNSHCQCSTTNLTPGTVVHRAELSLDGSGAVFREILLVV